MKRDQICDEVPDCADFTDELGCFNCKESESWCLTNKTSSSDVVCLSREKRCDGIIDCNKDEEDCSRITHLNAKVRF